MAKVRIKNISTYTVDIVLPNVRYRRDLAPGQIAPLPDDVVDEFNYDPGCRCWVKNGFLAVLTDDEEVKAVLPTAPENAEINVLEVLTKGTVADLNKLLKNSTEVIRDKIVALAIQNNITDAARCSLIKSYCEVDILAAVANQRAVE